MPGKKPPSRPKIGKRGYAGPTNVAAPSTDSVPSIYDTLPTDLLYFVLRYFDASMLARWEQTCLLARNSLEGQKGVALWQMATEYQFQWFITSKPSYISQKRFLLQLRKSCWPIEHKNDLDRPGRFYVLGGSCNRPAPMDGCECFMDSGGAKLLPGRYPAPFHKEAVPALQMERSAPGVARDQEDGLWVVGGWSGSEALKSVERLGVDPRTAQEGGMREHRVAKEDLVTGGSSWSGMPRRERMWTSLQPLETARCFLASVTDLQGRLYALGGGESIWQGARVLKSTEIMEEPLARLTMPWRPGPCMVKARCGLAAAASITGDIYAAGGYGGGTTYLSSVEVLRAGDSEGATREWLVDVVRPMHVARTGFGLAFGPDGCLFAVGGSPDGLHSHRRGEKYDVREGRWRWLPLMITPRGYCSAAFGPSGLLYVVGGQAGVTNDDAITRVVEVYDPRADKWRQFKSFGGENDSGVDRVDLGVVWALVP